MEHLGSLQVSFRFRNRIPFSPCCLTLNGLNSLPSCRVVVCKGKFRETGPSCQKAKTFSVGPIVAFIMPLFGTLSTVHSLGAESADAANGDGNRCALGEQISFQEIDRWGRGDPRRSDCTLWKATFLHPAISSGSPPTKPCSHAAAPRQNRGSPAHQRVPASSSDSHEQSHILSQGHRARERK